MSYYDGPERAQNIITDHSCLHETAIALIAQNIDTILKNQNEIKSIIFGNGKEDLRSIQSRQATMQKIQWWAIGVLIVGLAGLAFRSLF